MNPKRGIDGPEWVYPGDVVYPRDALLREYRMVYVCATYETNCLDYSGGGDVALFKIHPSLMKNAPQYERDRRCGFRRCDVYLPGDQMDFALCCDVK